MHQNHSEDFCRSVIECVRSRMSWSDTQLIRDILFMLASQGWEKAIEENDTMEAIHRLVERFSIPLESALANTGEIVGEFITIVQYAIQFISVSTLDYRAVWWRLFHVPTASEWSNVLILAKLLFSLPASNAKLERIFLQVNNIKTDKSSLLSNDTLDDLLLLTSDNVLIEDFCADPAIDLWWKSKGDLIRVLESLIRSVRWSSAQALQTLKQMNVSRNLIQMSAIVILL